MTETWSERGDGWYENDVDDEDVYDDSSHDASMCGGDEESCRCECCDCQVTGNWHHRGSFDWIG